MNLIYHNKSISITNCTSFFSRLKGFIGKKHINNALLFKRCNSIHTFFMKTNIDVIMCDKNYKILYYYNNLGKNKVILPKKNVSITIELPVNYFDISLNDYLTIK